MFVTSWKWLIGTAWMLMVVLVSYAVGPASAAGWTLCIVAAMTLPVIFARFWRQPQPSMSESIRDVLR